MGTSARPDDAADLALIHAANPDAADLALIHAASNRPSALDAGLTHAGVAATYGFARDIVPAAMTAIEHIPGAYKLFTDPSTGQPRTKAPSFDELRRNWTGELAQEKQAHPIASVAGDVAGSLASPLNTLLPGGPGVVGGLKGGAAAGALAAAGNANAADGTTASLEDRLGAAAKGGIGGAVAGAVLSPITGAIANRLSGPLVNKEVAAQADANAPKVRAAYDAAVRGGAPITDPDAIGEVKRLTQLPEWADAFRGGQSIARKTGRPVPDLPGLEGPVAPKTLTMAAADPAIAKAIQADNPGWSPARVLQAAQDPSVARGYASGVLGNTPPAPQSITPEQIETLRRGVSAGGDRDQIAAMQGLLKQKIDPLVKGYADARALAAKKYAFQELTDNPQPGVGSVMQPLIGVGQMATGGIPTKVAGFMKVLGSMQGKKDLSPEAQKLLEQIRGQVGDTPLGSSVDALGHMGWLLPAAGIQAAGQVPGPAPAPQPVA